ncbi:hypothetical protein IQ07DRAFT_647266 [Pyrenochaeta sp. DS3sAY3a]|nr:hypothetical protein IQ07DRAFT_647266 [Pyrenochaeta sp. DS3sAY3a]
MNHGKEIAMPEDDAVGMFNLCCVIHSRNNLCMKDPTPSDLLAIATTADKFGCLEPMQFAANVWLSSMDPEKIDRENPDIQGLAKLMAAAAMLDQPVAFQKITHQLMLHSNEPFDRLLGYIPDFDKSSLWPILFRLEEGRTRMRNRLQDVILSGL